MTVPTVDDVIQVGISGTTDTATILVTRTPTTLEVRRTDGAPLRAQILYDEPPIRRDVFGEPIRRLVVSRTGGDGWGHWRCDVLQTRGHRDEVNQFVRTVASFAAAKQLRAAQV
ncbi:hypothetical protein OG976_07850 [Mycobacterium sp. NBC_00419]|uniref:hypothetical protein n=1 Tax=Mycobacterium sp. NBC_00419 TaxID=2975989 RepID=UPI002E1D3858